MVRKDHTEPCNKFSVCLLDRSPAVRAVKFAFSQAPISNAATTAKSLNKNFPMLAAWRIFLFCIRPYRAGFACRFI